MSKKLVLIDGNSIANRAFWALPLLSNDKGTYTNAVYGFTTMLFKILEEEKPTHIMVAFDAGKETFRHKDFKEYKGTRQKSPTELSEQFPLIKQMLDGFSIKHYELKNYEADDIIGTLTKHADDEGMETVVFTGDKDMLQLVSQHTNVALTRKGISEVDSYTLDKMEETYQLKPEQIIDLKGLMGDSSDNIPGVPGVGEKTALKLLHQFETVENLYEQIDDVSGKKLKEKLVDNEEKAYLSKQLATILREAPIEVTIDDLVYEGYDKETLANVFQQLDFKSLLERLGMETEDKEAPITNADITWITKHDDSELNEALQSPAALHVEVFDDAYHEANILGYSLCNENGLYYIPTQVAEESESFINWLKDDNQQKWVYHAKRTHVVLKWKKIDIKGVNFDVFLAAYLLNPSESTYPLDSIARNYSQIRINSDEQVYGKGAKRQIPELDDESFVQHIAKKAQVIFDSKQTLENKLNEDELVELFNDLELPLSRILGEMEYEGFKVDRQKLKDMGQFLKEQIDTLTEQIHELAGVEFNINSPKQLGEVLFDKLGLPVIKKTKTGYSTSADVLEKLEPQHEVVGKILHFRQLGKLHSTYVEGLLKVINESTGKVHTNFQQTIASTGRLSSTDPNLQNIPIRLEEGRKIRQAFIPENEGHVILAADYSQIELRILAHISEDKGLIEAFNQDQDIHTKTAMDVFHVAQGEVTSLMRRHAKAVNFGIIYGISDFGLSQNLNISRKEAKDFIERYFESFPGVQTYMDNIVKEAKNNGYVTTLLNRRRYLPEINSRNFNMRSFAERTAMNTPIQGSAADIIKKAMVDMSATLAKEKLTSKLLIQVHDELIFDVPKNELDIMMKLVPEVMESAMQLKVPLKVDVEYGQTWYDAK